MVSNRDIDKALARAFSRQLPSLEAHRRRNSFQGKLVARGGGARCPECGSHETTILSSYDVEEGRRRNLECMGCFGKFTTTEKFDSKRRSNATSNIGVPVPGVD